MRIVFNDRGMANGLLTIPFRRLDRLVWLPVILLLVVGLAVWIGIDRPFVELYDYETVLVSAQARHYAQLGYRAVGFQNVNSVAPDGTIEYYARRLPLSPMLLSLVYRSVGTSIIVTRLFALLTDLGILAVFYFLIASIYDRRIAALATLLFALWPANLVFNARYVLYETMAMGLALLAAGLYVNWYRTRSAKWLLWLCVVVFLGSWSSWEFYFIVPVILLHWWLFGRPTDAPRQGRWLGLLIAIPVAAVTVQSGLSQLNGGTAQNSRLSLLGGIYERIIGGGNLLVDYLDLAHVFAVQVYYHFGVLAVVLSGLGIVMCIYQVWQARQMTSSVFWVAGLLAFGGGFFVAVRKILPGHDFLMMLVMPFMSLVAALGLVWLLSFVQQRGWPVAAMLLLVGGLYGASLYSGLGYFTDPDYGIPGNTAQRIRQFYDTSFLLEELQPGDTALTAFRMSNFPNFYLSPERIYADDCVLTLNGFETIQQAYGDDLYYVMYLEQVGEDQHLDDLSPPVVDSCPGGWVIDVELLRYLEAQAAEVYDKDQFRVVRLNGR